MLRHSAKITYRMETHSYMNQFQKYLPEHWNEWVRQFSLSTSGSEYSELGAGAFRGSVRLVFDDGSNAFFECAFFIEGESREGLAIFTECCGDHIFSSREVRAEYFEWTDPRLTLADGATETIEAEQGVADQLPARDESKAS